MDFTAIAARFGMSADDFDVFSGPVRSDDGFVYEAVERRDPRAACPKCRKKAEAHSHYWKTVKCRLSASVADTVRIRRTVYRCPGCGKTFTLPIAGAAARKRHSDMAVRSVVDAFMERKTFSVIATDHGISVTEAVRIFDEAFRTVRRLPMPRVLLMDEFHFGSAPGKPGYLCHLVDGESSATVDIIKSRKKEALHAYFSAVPGEEREKVRFVCSDMYEGYAYVARKFFPDARYVIDRFHVVTQLVRAVGILRTKAMKEADRESFEYSFMKRKWELFLCRAPKLPRKQTVFKRTGETLSYAEAVKRCIAADPDLSEGYEALQTLLSLPYRAKTEKEALGTVEWMARKLLNCSSETLRKVGRTYWEWKKPIAAGMLPGPEGAKVTNGKMEAMNNLAQAVKREGFGYGNFERFRKRALLILWRKHYRG